MAGKNMVSTETPAIQSINGEIGQMTDTSGHFSSMIFPDPDFRPGKKKTAILLVLGIALFITGTGCKKKGEPAMVDLDQIESDGSPSDRYQFKNEIEREKWREGRYKKKKF